MEDIPYDYVELLGAVAPRPTLLYTPTQDRDANYSEVRVRVCERVCVRGR